MFESQDQIIVVLWAVRVHPKASGTQTADDRTNTVPVVAYSFCHVKHHVADKTELPLLLFVYSATHLLSQNSKHGSYNE